MKKIIIAALAAAIAFTSCKVDLGQRRTEFATSLDNLIKEFNETFPTIESNEEAQAYYDETINTLKSICRKTIKKNADNSLGLDAFDEVRGYLSQEELQEYAAMLKGENAEAPIVVEALGVFAAQEATAEGKMFTDFEVNGVRFSDFVGQGKWVLVDFWASWCGPCKAEIPNIAAVYEKYHGENFDVLSVAVWDKLEDTIPSAKEHGIVWNQIVDAQKVPTDIYGIEGIPHIMLIAPDGTIAKRNLRGEAIEAAVREALGL